MCTQMWANADLQCNALHQFYTNRTTANQTNDLKPRYAQHIIQLTKKQIYIAHSYSKCTHIYIYVYMLSFFNVWLPKQSTQETYVTEFEKHCLI